WPFIGTITRLRPHKSIPTLHLAPRLGIRQRLRATRQSSGKHVRRLAMNSNTLERFQLPKLAAVALGGLLLAGCAGNPPTEQFAVTESAVRSAVSAGGTEYAAVEMRTAQEKWKQAE